MPYHIWDLGQLVNLAGPTGDNALPLGSDFVKTLEIGNPNRVLFNCHVEFDAATALANIQFKLQVSYNNVHWADVAMRKSEDDSLFSPAVFTAAKDMQLYTEAARGAPYARLLARAAGVGPVKAGDKLSISGTYW